jgi:hypothetical protein
MGLSIEAEETLCRPSLPKKTHRTMLKRRKAREAILGPEGDWVGGCGTYLGPNSAYLGPRAPGAQKGWQWSRALHGVLSGRR